MAQELVLIPKSKYEYLLSKCDGSLQNSQPSKNNNMVLQQNGKNSQKRLTQNGGKLQKKSIQNDGNLQKRLVVKRLNKFFEKPKKNKKKNENLKEIKSKQNKRGKTKIINKLKWIPYSI